VEPPQHPQHSARHLFGQCGASLPLPEGSAVLPIGLQLTCRDGDDARLLAIAQGIETVFGKAPARDMRGFRCIGVPLQAAASGLAEPAAASRPAQHQIDEQGIMLFGSVRDSRRKLPGFVVVGK